MTITLRKPLRTLVLFLNRFVVIFCLSLISLNILQAQHSVKWEFNTEGEIFGTASFDDANIYIGSGDQKIYCLNKKTGEKIWEFSTKDRVQSSPLLVDNLVICGSGDGNLYAIDKNTGEEIWKFSSEGEKVYGLWDYYLSSPKRDGNMIYWGSGDGYVYALESQTGMMKWKYQTQSIVHADPVIHGDALFIGSFDGNLYALNKNNGELQWKFKTLGAQYFPKGEIQKAVFVEDGTVYFGSRDYNLYALDINTGAVKWKMSEPNGWIIATPIVHGDLILFGTSDGHKFYCLNKNSGVSIWELPLRMRVFGSAKLYKGVVYFGTFDGKVMAVDIETGKEIWQFQTKGSRKNYATVFNDQGEFKEGFSLYGKDIVETERKIIGLGAVLATPVIDQNTLYFGSSDGTFYAVSL